MASGSLGADEETREREKSSSNVKWSENSKVYTRKIFKANRLTNNKKVTSSSIVNSSQSQSGGNEEPVEKRDNGVVVEKSVVLNGVVDVSKENEKEKEIEVISEVGDVSHRPESPPKAPVVEEGSDSEATVDERCSTVVGEEPTVEQPGSTDVGEKPTVGKDGLSEDENEPTLREFIKKVRLREPVQKADVRDEEAGTAEPVEEGSGTPVVDYADPDTPIVNEEEMTEPVGEESLTPPVEEEHRVVSGGEETAVPMEETKTVAPVEESNTVTPMEETDTVVPPAEETNTLVPMEGANTVMPTEEMDTVVPPTEETNTLAPMEETNTVTPMEETNTAAPMDETNAVAPMGKTSTVAAMEEADTAVPSKELDTRVGVDEAGTASPVVEPDREEPMEEPNRTVSVEHDDHREVPLEEGVSTVPVEETNPRVTLENTNSSQRHRFMLRLENSSGDPSNHRKPPEVAVVPNGHEDSMVNGLSRPLVTRIDDRVSINVSTAVASQVEEVRAVKRKLEGELDRVRKMARRLEAKEVQLSEYSSGGIGGVASTPVIGNLQKYPVNGGLGKGLGSGFVANSDIGSVGYADSRGSAGYNESRPFRHLSVSVMDHSYGGIGEIPEKEKRTPKANQFYRNSEFILGKDKLPPAESNKKSKSSGGKKHGGRGSDYGMCFDKQVHRNCSSALQKLMKHKHGWVFNQPVDVQKLGLHDYFDIIKHPMDLGTVKSRLSNNWYKSPREFAEDVRLTFHNAMTYNPEGQDVHVMAKDLLRQFEEKWPAIEAEYESKLRYAMIRNVGAPTPTSRKTYAPVYPPTPVTMAPRPALRHPPSFQEARHLERSMSMPIAPESRSKPAYSVGRTPVPRKPKAKDPNKRDMTFEEKQKLSNNLQNLPPQKLDAIVQIIKKRNSAFSQHDDEIEVDIDSVDAETLWELDRFVMNFKKSQSKNKRKQELAEARAEAAKAAAATAPQPTQAIQQPIPPPVNVEPAVQTRPDEGNISTSPRAEQSRHTDNDTGSSSSSGSSSDSGSSSSDSDSDSSSDSDSDEGH